jgi:hypothetical protein
MRLRYDYDLQRYVGAALSVTEGTFLSALRRLIAVGEEPEAALDQVLEEAAWQVGTVGVLALPATATCRACGRPLARPRRAFCDVVCEATLRAREAPVG